MRCGASPVLLAAVAVCVFAVALACLAATPARKMSARATAATTAGPRPGAAYPALFICHGGGPLPLLGEAGSAPLVASWQEHARDIVRRAGPPRAIAVVSAHYTTRAPEVGGAALPAMLFDYYGFPPETYRYKYDAPGHPALALEMANALREAGFNDASVNPTRAFDHGVFVPLMRMFAEANVPVVPISVLHSDDPAEHIRIGQALRDFRRRGVFFIGSGSSMHHFGNLDKPNAGARFGDALTGVLAAHPGRDAAARIAAMQRVRNFAGFDEAQPRGANEHLMPLLVLLGAAGGGPAREVANVPFGAANVRHYVFDD